MGGATDLDRILRAFHASAQCESANRALAGRRAARASAWDSFICANGAPGSATELARAKHLDYVMRTSLFEGHLKRGCNACGTCDVEMRPVAGVR